MIGDGHVTPVTRLLARLDVYGTDEPGFREGFPEDRCPLCSRAVDEHPCWRHRRVAVVAMLVERIR